MTFGDEISSVAIAEALNARCWSLAPRKAFHSGWRESFRFLLWYAIGHIGTVPAQDPTISSWASSGPEEEVFARSIVDFARACAAVDGFLGARIGMFGRAPRAL